MPHAGNQVLAMLYAGQQNSGNVNKDQEQGRICQEFMGLFKDVFHDVWPVLNPAGKRTGMLFDSIERNARYSGTCEEGQ